MSMDDTSARLALPLLHPGQAQKEADHNEALALIDIATQASVGAIGIDTPPSAPGAGDCWIVGAAPTGDWAGHPASLAGWTAGGWRFVAPIDGMAVWDRASGTVARFLDGVWRTGEVSAARLVIDGKQIVGSRRAAINQPVGGNVVDIEARNAVVAILAALVGHGLIET